MTKAFSAVILAAVSATVLSGCMTTGGLLTTVRHHAGEASSLYSSPVRSNVTPMNDALQCLGSSIVAKRGAPVSIAVGDIKDYTGKQSQDEGYVVTQGGALMAYSALGKLGGGVRIHERFDTRIAEAELLYSDRRQLGDGTTHEIPNAETGTAQAVPWKPYMGGSIRQSEYFIIGGITELNYNIHTGGAELAVSGIGPKARVYTMNVAVDLRIVGTQSLMIYDTVSLEKQITGYEVGAGVFRFFGNDLFDINLGGKSQEPLQLGIRTAIEAAVAELVGTVANVDPRPCMPESLQPVGWDSASARSAAIAAAETQSMAYAPVLDREPEAVAWAEQSAVPLRAVASRGQASELSLAFEPGETALSTTAVATIKRATDLLAGGHQVNLTLAARDMLGIPSEHQATLLQARINAVAAALQQRGIGADRASMLWGDKPLSLQGLAIQEIAKFHLA